MEEQGIKDDKEFEKKVTKKMTDLKLAKTWSHKLKTSNCQTFPISAKHIIDLKYMLQFERQNPSKWKRIYRSKFNSRNKATNSNINKMKIVPMGEAVEKKQNVK